MVGSADQKAPKNWVLVPQKLQVRPEACSLNGAAKAIPAVGPVEGEGVTRCLLSSRSALTVLGLLSLQLEIAQKHPDIYAVPVKLPKHNLNRPQPIG